MKKTTGIVRRIDDLGRVVIPKEIRRTVKIREGDPLQIYTDDDGEVIFKKYSPLGDLGILSAQYADVLFRCGGHPVLVCDTDMVIAVAGHPKKELLERRVSAELQNIAEGRKRFEAKEGQPGIRPVEGVEHRAFVVAPILAAGDVYGSIMLLSDTACCAGEAEVKLIATAATFLGLQLED